MEKEQTQIVLKELDKSIDRVDFSQLPEGDKFQVLIRYFNDMCSLNKSSLQIMADLYVLMEFICEHLGIDVKKKKMELARQIKAQMDKNIEESKKELKEVSKNKKA